MVIFFLWCFRKVRLLKNAVSERWCTDSSYMLGWLLFQALFEYHDILIFANISVYEYTRKCGKILYKPGKRLW